MFRSLGGGAVRSPLVVGSPSWACRSGEHPWRCAQLPNGEETRRRARPRPPGLGAALGPCGHRRSFLLASAGPPRGGFPAGPVPPCHWAGVAEYWLVGATPAVALWSTGDAGGASALATVSKLSGFVGTAASAAIRTPAADHWNMARVQPFPTAAPLASEAWSRCPVRRPLNCGGRLRAYGEVAESG